MLVIALFLALFLAFFATRKDIHSDQKIVFVLDINRTMNTRDVFSGTQQISRLQAAKSIIQKTILSDPQFSYGLLLFNVWFDYLIPPTFDTWTFLLYLSGITTNLLPDWSKDFAQLNWVLTDTYTSYIVISDFDTNAQKGIRLPKSISLLWLWSLAWDKVRYANWILYYDNGKSVFSARNDQFAQSLNLPYTSLTNVDTSSLQKLLFHGINLPLSQRIVLYVVLGVLVILVVLL